MNFAVCDIPIPPEGLLDRAYYSGLVEQFEAARNAGWLMFLSEESYRQADEIHGDWLEGKTPAGAAQISEKLLRGIPKIGLLAKARLKEAEAGADARAVAHQWTERVREPFRRIQE